MSERALISDHFGSDTTMGRLLARGGVQFINSDLWGGELHGWYVSDGTALAGPYGSHALAVFSESNIARQSAQGGTES